MFNVLVQDFHVAATNAGRSVSTTPGRSLGVLWYAKLTHLCKTCSYSICMIFNIVVNIAMNKLTVVFVDAETISWISFVFATAGATSYRHLLRRSIWVDWPAGSGHNRASVFPTGINRALLTIKYERKCLSELRPFVKYDTKRACGVLEFKV